MKFPFWLTVLALLRADAALGASSSKDKPLKPCTARSPTTERFFDLNPIHRTPPEEGKKPKGEDEGSWHARGYDVGYNFTMNFCGPVVEELDNVQDLDKKLWKNVSAFYEKGDKQYSLGQLNEEPIFRGSMLVLEYTGGSLCSSSKKRSVPEDESPTLSTKNWVCHHHDEDDGSKKWVCHKNGNDDEDGDDEPPPPPKEPSKGSKERRKSAIISLLCESDPLAKTRISFVGAGEDECTYFFQARSPAACSVVEKETQALGPGGVFGVIVLIAVMVYLVGGCVYQRTVMHQRGWRQLPNYTMWAGLWSFIQDIFVILTSSCARCLPSRRGYNRVSLPNNYGSVRIGRRANEEDRLIDNLDEEWAD